MKLTKAQEQALNTKNKNILLSAGAGSGKTFILTNRIINLAVEEKIPLERFVVVTFTKKAAMQMKSKIRKILRNKIKENKEDKEFLFAQMDSLGSCNISTFHSFCLNIISKHYMSLGLDSNFKILEDTNLLKQEALEEVFSKKFLENTPAFNSLINNYSNDLNNEDLKGLILNLYRNLMNRPSPFTWLEEEINEFLKEDIKETKHFSYLLKRINELLDDSENALNKALEKAKLVENEKIITLLTTDLDLAKTIKKDLKTDISKFSLYNETSRLFKNFPSKLDVDQTILNQIKALRNKSKNFIKEATSYIPFSEDTLYSMMKNIHPYIKELGDILKDFDKNFKEKKLEKGVVDFSDLEHFACEILQNEEIRNSIIKDIDYVFVDEYQDTSLIQEEVIRKITKENNLFSVGDVKQSIYSFRASNPDIFINRSKAYKKEESKDSVLINMDTNFRSSPTIIHGINKIFSLLMTKDIGHVPYKEEGVLTPGKNDISGEKIQIHLINEEEREEDPVMEELLSLDKKEKQLHYLAKLIVSALKEEIFDEEINTFRKVTFEDIAILSRNIRNTTPKLEEIFNLYSIPFNASSEGSYYDYIEIRMITDLLKVINNFYDDLSLVSVMYGPVFKFSPDELIEIKINGVGNFFYEHVLSYNNDDKIKEKIGRMLETLDFFYQKSLFSSLKELLESIYSNTLVYDYISTLPMGENRVCNLNQLLVKTTQYENYGSSNLYSFINHLENLKLTNANLEIKTLSNTTGVQYMSIHKSKGLEFPVVFLINAHSVIRDRNVDSVLYSDEFGLCPEYINIEKGYKAPTSIKTAGKLKQREKELFEEIRILYVALTRAKNKLFILGLYNFKNEISEYIQSDFSKNTLFSSPSYLKWILMSLLKEEKGNNLWNKEDDSIIFEDDFFKIITKNLEDELPDKKEEARESYSFDKEKIKEKLNFKYKYEAATKIPSKISISDLNMDIANDYEFLKVPSLVKTPSFMEEKKYTPEKKGSILHLILESIDLKAYKSGDIKNQTEIELSRLLENNIISKEDLENINIEYINNFLMSEVGRDLINSEKIYRETPFTLSLSPDEFSDILIEEKILIQGIIDCFYINEKGSVILIDYKTNYYNTKEERDFLIGNFKTQLSLYKKAIRDILNLEVEKSYIYFLSKNEQVEV